MDRGVGDRNAARGADRVAQADRPAVLDERDRGGGVVRNGLVEGPEPLLGREVATVGLARRAEADQRADNGADTVGLAGGEVGMMQTLDGTVGALVNDQQVEDADDVALPQALELGEHVAAEVGPVEADDQELDRSEGHGGRQLAQPVSTLRFAIWNSSGERAPSSRSAFSALSCSTTSGAADARAARTAACRWASILLPSHLVHAGLEADAAEHHRRAPQRPEQHGASISRRREGPPITLAALGTSEG